MSLCIKSSTMHPIFYLLKRNRNEDWDFLSVFILNDVVITVPSKNCFNMSFAKLIVKRSFPLRTKKNNFTNLSRILEHSVLRTVLHEPSCLESGLYLFNICKPTEHSRFKLKFGFSAVMIIGCFLKFEKLRFSCQFVESNEKKYMKE